MAISGKSVLSLVDGVSTQALGEGEGGVVLRVDTGELFTCNDTTIALLQCAEKEMSFDAAIAALLDQFDVGETELRADMQDMGEELAREGILSIE